MKRIFILFLLLLQCTGEDVCNYEINGIITQVSDPIEVNVNSNANFDLTILPTNGCVKFDRFDVTKNGFNWFVRAINKGTDCGCNEPVESFSKVYVFNESVPGTYNIQFLGDNFQVITRVLNVIP
ncbi:MAG: hypothetical protein ACK4JX_05110 [Flavobacterium sp.]